MEPIVIKDFLPEMYKNEMEGLFLSQEFPWYRYDSTYSTGYEDGNEIPVKERITNGAFDDGLTKESPQFVHTMYKETKIISDFYTVVRPLFWFLQQKTGITLNNLYRIKLNLMLQDKTFPEGYHNMSHTDANIFMPDGIKVLIYYPQDSDGDTFFFNQHLSSVSPETKLTVHSRTSPQKGTAVLFDAKQLHASSPPVYNKTRLALNLVFS